MNATPVHLLQKQCRLHMRGFTMMELLISLSIAAIIAVTGITSYITAIGNQRLSFAAEKLTDTLHQSRAFSREAKDSLAWGTENTNLFSYRFVSLDADSNKNEESTTTLPSGITFTSFFSVWFDKGSGDLPAPQTITLQNAHGQTVTLTISETGLVSQQ